jgi:D-alanyl-D-alanine carboxypeptidase
MTARAACGTVHDMPHLRPPLAAAACAAALLPTPALARDAAPPASLRSALSGVVDAGAPGAVALSGRRVVAAGLARRGGREPLTGRTPIRIGSVTKSFTAAVVLQLVAEHRLSLEDTVGERLPGVLPAADAVTLRQLLDHTSGIPDDVPTPLAQVLGGETTRLWTPRDVIALVADEPLRFAPGTGWAYSNTDYVLAGLMVERATGATLGSELRRRIVRPLHLRDTRFPVRSARLGGRAHGYSLPLGPGGPVPGRPVDVTDYSPSFAWASGNGVSTLRDLARFQRALLDGRLLRPAMRRAMLQTVATGKPGLRAGLGVDVVRTPAGTRIGHEGDILGFSVKLLSDARGRRTAIVAANLKLSPPAVGDALDAARDAALRAACARSCAP